MPDGRFVPLGSYESRVIAHRYIGEQESLADQAHTEWLRADEAFDTLADVIGSLESIRGLSDALEDAKGWLDNAKAQIRAVCKGEG